MRMGHRLSLATLVTLCLIVALNVIGRQLRLQHLDELHGIDEAVDLRLAQRLLSSVGDLGTRYVTEDDYDAAYAAAWGGGDIEPTLEQERDETSKSRASAEHPPLPTYTLEDVLSESTVFQSMFAMVIYDPPNDKFLGLYSKSHSWRSGNRKLWRTIRDVAYMLRQTFPERFTPESPEMVFALGSGDYPHVRPASLPHEGVAPVLMFGSAFRDGAVYPNMIPMPMPNSHHLDCFMHFVDFGETCMEMRDGPDGDLVFGERFHLQWEDLIVSSSSHAFERQQYSTVLSLMYSL